MVKYSLSLETPVLALATFTTTSNILVAVFDGVISGTKTSPGPIFTVAGTGNTILGGPTRIRVKLSSLGINTDPKPHVDSSQPVLINTTDIKVVLGGTLLVQNADSANTINDGATITLAGGTFQLGGVESERGGNDVSPTAGVGALTLLPPPQLTLAAVTGSLSLQGLARIR